MKKIFCKYSIILIFLSSFTNAYASNDREWDYKINSAKKSCVKIGFAENDPKFKKNCFSYLLTELWNSLPSQLRLSRNANYFN